VCVFEILFCVQHTCRHPRVLYRIVFGAKFLFLTTMCVCVCIRIKKMPHANTTKEEGNHKQKPTDLAAILEGTPQKNNKKLTSLAAALELTSLFCACVYMCMGEGGWGREIERFEIYAMFTCICMYVCMYVCVYVCMYVYVHTCTCKPMCVWCVL